MPEREVLTDGDVCDLAQRWGVSVDTVQRVWLAAQDFHTETGRQVWIISGFRTRAEQQRLSSQGRPTAPDELSTHRSCPATGVDISLGARPSNFLKATWGRLTLIHGLRWGGGGAVDPDSFIPLDWQHVDVGPRKP